MKSSFVTGLVVYLLTFSITGNAQESLTALTDEEVAAAIGVGMDDNEDNFEDLFAVCGANPGWRENLGAAFNAGLTGDRITHGGGYSVTFTSHMGQIAMASADRKSKYMPAPEPSEFPDEWRQPVLRLWIEPQGDSSQIDGTIDLAASISHVIIRPEDRDNGAVQPISFETEPVDFSNMLGAQFTSTRAVATFPAEGALDAVADRDLEAVIITPAGERKCDISKNSILRMFGFKNGR